LGGGAVDVDTRPGQASEGDDEEQNQDEERRQQHQLRSDASGLVPLHAAGMSWRLRRVAVVLRRAGRNCLDRQ